MANIGLLEDNTRIAKLCVTMLGYAGHDVTVYIDACECLRALAAPDPFLTPLGTPAPSPSGKGPERDRSLPIDVLILDLHLPTMTGLEALHHLRNNPRTCRLPLIFCTAATPSELNMAFAIAPEATLVEKPFRLQALTSAISDALLLPR